MEQVKQSMGSYPRGRLVVKKVKAKERVYELHHLQWREGKKGIIQAHPRKRNPGAAEKNRAARSIPEQLPKT